MIIYCTRSLRFYQSMHVTCAYLYKFHPSRITPEQLWRHIDFYIWRPWRHNSYSGCVFSDKWHSSDIILIHSWVITTSSFRKQMGSTIPKIWRGSKFQK